MRYIRLLKLLIVESFIDDLVKNIGIEKSIRYGATLREIYGSIALNIRQHNKFSKFFKWIVDKDIDKLMTMTSDTIEILFRNYLKYNLKLEDYKELVDLEDAINDKEHAVNLIIDESLAKKIYEDDEKVVLMPWNHEGSLKYGVDGWCISNNRNVVESRVHWFSYILKEDCLLSYFVIYKKAKPRVIDIIDNEGDYIDVQKANIQIDLDGRLYITNINNTVGRGIQELDKVDKILDYMNLDKSIFKSFKEIGDEEFKKFIEKNKGIIDYMFTYMPNSKLMERIRKVGGKELLFEIEWFEACKNLNMAKIMEYVNTPSFNINTGDFHGKTGLHYLAANGSGELIQKVLDKRPDIDINKEQGAAKYIPIMLAIMNDNANAVETLLNRKDLDVNKLTSNKNNILTLALIHGEINIFKLILDKRPDIDIHIKNNFDKSVLYYLIVREPAETDAFKYLLSKRNDVDFNMTYHGKSIYDIISSNFNAAYILYLMDEYLLARGKKNEV